MRSRLGCRTYNHSFIDNMIKNNVVIFKEWLCKINVKNRWHHLDSPLVWKEVLHKGSKPYYIGGVSQFFEYCHSYYAYDGKFIKTSNDLFENIAQFEKKDITETDLMKRTSYIFTKKEFKDDFCVCISGAGFFGIKKIISGLLDLQLDGKSISKIFIYDEKCPLHILEAVEKECNYVVANSCKTVRCVTKLGVCLGNTDLLIVMDHVPFESDDAIGTWLYKNKELMKSLGTILNLSASVDLRIIFPNLGPACYNATMLTMFSKIDKNNIVVATSDLGLEVLPILADIAQVPLKNIYCPPVWGFVGINHLVDIRTTIHKYNSFEPYDRYTKIKNSTLCVGSLTPEFRTMEYLVYFDETLWTKVAKNQIELLKGKLSLNKSRAVVNIVEQWLFGAASNNIVNLGVKCDGSFGLKFEGIFSQPARLNNGKWEPASDYMLPKDPNMKLPYIELMADKALKFKVNDIPSLHPYYPCTCVVPV